MRVGQYRHLYKILALVAALMLSGCEHVVLMDPKGSIGVEQRGLIITSLLLMLIVVIPAILMTIFFAWKYRESNTKAKYTPDWDHSNKIEFVVWTVPLVIIIILGVITWRSAHELDPRAAIPAPNGDGKTMTIEAISLDWKWLFIYPEQGVASINQVVFPANVPIKFKVTSYTVMNSFFIPQLGSQIYAMAGMNNKVHLIANHIGHYQGISSNYSGLGFSGMKFTAEATTEQEFSAWLAKTRQSPLVLNSMSDFEQIAKPSENNPVEYFSSVKPGLYQDIINKFMGHNMSQNSHSAIEE